MSPTPAQVIIGLDVGTTAVKAVAFGRESDWRFGTEREFPVMAPAPGQAVQDPAAIAAAVSEALGECVRAVGSAEVLGISLSAAMHGLLGLDEALKPLTPLVIWADARAAAEARELRASGRSAALHRLTGVPTHPMTPLSKLMWFGRQEPVTFAAVRWWIGLKDWLIWQLTGELRTELSSASGTGLLDLSSRGWSDEAIGVAGIRQDQLPPIIPTTAVLTVSAALADRVGLRRGTPVIAGAADGPLGNLGTGAMSPGVAGLSLGTSGALRIVCDGPVVDDRESLFCYALTESVWVVGGAVSNGGSVARWAARTLVPDLVAGSAVGSSDEALLALAATAPAGCDGLVMLPLLVPERGPLNDPDSPGAFLGLREWHGRPHLVRAAIEGVCLQLRAVLQQLDSITPVTAVRATGGTFASPLWREVMAATLDRPFYAIGDKDGTALGAAALGLHALGLAPELTEAAGLLSAPDAPPAEPLAISPELVASYAAQRARLAELISAVVPLGRLLAG